MSIIPSGVVLSATVVPGVISLLPVKLSVGMTVAVGTAVVKPTILVGDGNEKADAVLLKVVPSYA